MSDLHVCLSCGAYMEGDVCPKCGAEPTLELYGYSIKKAVNGGGFILCKGDTAHSEIKDTNKYRDAVCLETGIPREVLDRAVASAKLQTSDETENEENPGAVIVRIAQANSEAIFKDQLDETYITYLEKLDITDIKDVVDMKTPIVIPSPQGVYSNIDYEKTPSDQQSNNRDTDVHDVQNAHDVQEIEVKRTVRIRSRECKQWLAKLYYTATGKTPGNDSINSASLVLEAEAKEKRILYNRVAPDGSGGIWWDMADQLGRAIHITRDGWEIIQDPPQIFKHYAHQLPLAEPAENGSLTPLLDYIILNDPKAQLLNVVTPITWLIPEVPHVIELVYGVKGATKSSGHRFKRLVVDPSATPLLTLPKDADQMVQHADHHYLLIYDNVSNIDEEQSDLLCRMVTGLGFSKRMLYTDDDVIIRQLMRCVAINGINLPVDKPDLLDRGLIQVADIMEDKDRKTEAAIKQKMLEDAPRVIRAFLDVLVKAMNLYDEIQPIKNNRMADYTRWGCAITQALGLDPRHFELAYHKNIETQNEEAVKSNPVAEWLIQWFNFNNFTHGYTGSASELLDDILRFADEQYNRDLNWIDGWPKGSRPFGKKLQEVIPSLTELGYKIVYEKSGSRKYKITKIVDDINDNETKGQRSLFIAFENTAEELTEDKLREALKEVQP